jgi:hypothetical protein
MKTDGEKSKYLARASKELDAIGDGDMSFRDIKCTKK